MKRLNFTELKTLLMIAFLAISLTSLTSCNNDDDDDPMVPGVGNIVEVAANNDDFSFLVTAITEVSNETSTDVAALLSDETQRFTVFAPTNSAFIDAGFPSIQSIKDADANVLLGILTYHVLSGETKSTAVPTGPNANVTTLAQKDIFLTKKGAAVFVNGISVTQADIATENGVIHVVNRVIVPPSGNIVETAVEKDFDLLVTAINYVDDKLDAGIATLLSDGTKTFTVFAPTDAAFIAALDGADGSTKNGAVETAELDAMGATNLANILKLHVIEARVFSSDLTEGAQPQTLNTTDNITISLANGATVTGSGNEGATANIAVTDVVTTNGVVHAIDRVLLPVLPR